MGLDGAEESKKARNKLVLQCVTRLVADYPQEAQQLFQSFEHTDGAPKQDAVSSERVPAVALPTTHTVS